MNSLFKNTFLGILLFTMSPVKLFSCSCYDHQLSILHLFTQDIFFKGEVIGKEFVTQETEPSKYEYTFKIEEVIKGEYESHQIKVYSNSSSASCGEFFFIGQKLYIFANIDQNKFHTNLCSLNQYAEREDSFIQKLIRDYKNEDQLEWFDFSGNKVAEGKIRNGKQEGYWKIKYKNGDIIEEGNFINGQKDGEWQIFRSRKRPSVVYKQRFLEIFKNGKKIRIKKY